MGKDEELSLLLKEIITLETLKSQSPNLYPKRDLLFWSKSVLIFFFPNYKGSFHMKNKVYNCQKYIFLKRSHNRIFPIIIGNPLSRISSIRKLSITFQINSKYNLRLFLTMSTLAQIPKIQTNLKVFKVTSLPYPIGAFRYY